MLGAAECLRKEPALGLATGEFAGGIWTADACVADPHRLCQAMVRSLRERGGAASFGLLVQSFVREGRRFLAARVREMLRSVEALYPGLCEPGALRPAWAGVSQGCRICAITTRMPATPVPASPYSVRLAPSGASAPHHT